MSWEWSEGTSPWKSLTSWRAMADELQHIVDLGLGHGLRGGITGEKGWGHLVDALVSALGTEERGYQQLESRTKLELGGNLGHGFTIIIEHTLVTLLTGHNKICVG